MFLHKIRINLTSEKRVGAFGSNKIHLIEVGPMFFEQIKSSPTSGCGVDILGSNSSSGGRVDIFEPKQEQCT